MSDAYLFVRVLFPENYRQFTQQRPQTRRLVDTGNALLLQRHARRRQHLRLVVEIGRALDDQHILLKHDTDSFASLTSTEATAAQSVEQSSADARQ